MDAQPQDIDEYFARPLGGAPARVGRASGWLSVGSLAVRSGTLATGDAVLFPGDQLALQVERGEYTVEVIALDYGADRRIARLRVALPGLVATATPRSAGTVAVEFAVVGVCDGREFLEALEQVGTSGEGLDRYRALYLDRLAATERPWAVVALPAARPTAMVTVSAGWGDGEYAVYRLEVDGRGVGVEVEFIPLNTPYPFRQTNA